MGPKKKKEVLAQKIPAVKDLIKKAVKTFTATFTLVPTIAVYAPGSINLLGSHTDYNDGFALPIALPMVTIMVGVPVEGETSVVMTTQADADKPRKVAFDMPNRVALCRKLAPGEPKWCNYIKGVISHHAGKIPSAFKALIVSTIPTGVGFCSSAALEMATYMFLDALGPAPTVCPYSLLYVEEIDKALACQKAEHEYANTPCPLMDQLACIMSRQNNALLIDCKTMKTTHIPFEEPLVTMVVIDPKVKYEMTAAELRRIRREQCERAAKMMKKTKLRDATLEDLDILRNRGADEWLIRRARHVITENMRVNEATEALKDGDYRTFGRILFESHNSLDEDFGVSSAELNELVYISMKVKGVLGSRMLGVGYSGCVLTLIKTPILKKYIRFIKTNYTGNLPLFYTFTPSDGCRVVWRKPSRIVNL